MQSFTASQVFVPGGMPKYTYVPRLDKNLEERLKSSKDNLCKLVTVTGTTKSGKTVLTSKIFPRGTTNVWIDGGAIGEEDDLWGNILEGLEGFTETNITNEKKNGFEVGGGMGATAGLPLFAHAEGKVEAKYEHEASALKGKSRTVPLRTAALSSLKQSKTPLIIDDFHYLSRNFQGTLIRALKPLIFDGLPVILIAIPHRRYDPIKVEREMTGRLESIEIPSWEIGELKKIPQEGFPLLNIQLSDPITTKFATEAYGSPHLMQDFCRNLCRLNNIDKTLPTKLTIGDVSDDIFKQVAQGTGKVIFDRLAKGPRQRTYRIKRELKAGGKVDIYQITLMALSRLAPGLKTIEYTEIRDVIRGLLKDNIPQAHEISRVFEQMSKIATHDESSTPVLDWDKEERKLHITDPYFAFYLKWGIEQ